MAKPLTALTFAAFVGLTGAASASSFDNITAAKGALQGVSDPAVEVQVESLIRDAVEQNREANHLRASQLADEATRLATQG